MKTSSQPAPNAITQSPQTQHYPKMLVISVVIAILLMAVNMRASIIGLGAVAKWVQHDLGLTTKTIGMIGTIPVMAFALSLFVAPMISRRLGLETTVTMATMLLALGIFVRSWQPQLALLLSGTVMLSVAIALGNVLIPAVIKKFTPQKISLVMGIYSLFLSVFAGVSAGVMPLLSERWNWQVALGSWGWISVMAFVVWVGVKRWLYRYPNTPSFVSVNPVSPTASPISSGKRSVWTMPMAWFISIYMGLQSLLYYTLASFLPSLLQDKGLDNAQVSHMGILFQVMALPSIMLLSKWASANWNIRALALAATISNLIGVMGLGFFSVQLAWLWAIFAGFGCGVIFTLCMMLFTIKSRDSQQAAELSGMAQSVGYSVAFFGPIITGVLKDWTHDWQMPMLLLTILMLINCGMCWLATQNKPIDS